MRYPPLLIALFVAMLLKPSAESTGAAVLAGGFFLLLVFGTLIYAFCHIRSLAFCLTVLGVATVTLRFLADQRHVPTLAILSQGLSFIAMIVAMVAMFFRGASSAQCFVRSGYGRGLLVPGYRTGLDVSLLFKSTCSLQAQFSFQPRPPFGPLQILRQNTRKYSTSALQR
jgi:hypothetical protein